MFIHQIENIVLVQIFQSQGHCERDVADIVPYCVTVH